MSSGGMGGIDTSMYAPPARKSMMERGAETTALINSVTQNQLMRTSIQAEQLKISMEQLQGMRKDFAALNGKKNPTIADAQRIIKQREDLGLINPEDSAVWQSEIPDTEEEIRDWAKDQATKAMEMGQMIETLFSTLQIDQGPNVMTGPYNQMTGEMMAEPLITPKGLPPEGQMQRIPTVDSEGRPGSVPMRDLAPNDLLNPGGPTNGGFMPDPAATLPGAPLEEAGPAAEPVETMPGGAPAPQEPAVITDSAADGFLPTGLAPGDEEAIAAFTKAKEEQSAYGARTTPLMEALEKIQKTGTGPGTESVNEIRSFLLSAEPLVEEMLGRDLYDASAIEVADYDTLRKYLNQYSLAVARDMGATEGQLLATGGASPGTHISQMANQQVLQMNLALERMQRARVQEFRAMVESGEATEADWLDYSSEWADGRDVRAYAADMMTLAELKKMRSSMTTAEKKKFDATLDAAANVGVIDAERIGARG